jgi:hypothetical protein
MSQQHSDDFRAHFDRRHCSCSDCRQKRHHRFDHRPDDICTCGREKSFPNKRHQIKQHTHCDCNECKRNNQRQSFQKLPSLRNHKSHQHHLDQLSRSHHVDHGDRHHNRRKNVDFSDSLPKVIQEDGKKNIVIIM